MLGGIGFICPGGGGGVKTPAVPPPLEAEKRGERRTPGIAELDEWEWNETCQQPSPIRRPEKSRGSLFRAESLPGNVFPTGAAKLGK